MSEFDQARAALRNLGVADTDQMSDRDVQNTLSTLFGSLVAFSGSIATGLNLSVESVARLFRTFADVMAPEDPDPVSALVERLAEIE